MPNIVGMSDSNDFTFLPPLDKQQQPIPNSYSPSRQLGRNSSNQKLNYLGEGSSTNSLGPDAIIRQVQVHSSTKNNARAVPVPSQRITFAKMEERRNATSKYASNPSPNEIERPPSRSGSSSHGRIPSVEDLNLPESSSFY